MVSGSICTLLSGMLSGLANLGDSRHRVAGVTDTGSIIHGIVERSGSAEKQSIWNCGCQGQKVLSILLCSSQYPTMRL